MINNHQKLNFVCNFTWHWEAKKYLPKYKKWDFYNFFYFIKITSKVINAIFQEINNIKNRV